MKPIVQAPQSVLTTPTKPITSFDKKLHRLLQDMREALLATKNPKGVGLAAPQIGEPYQIFITKPTVKAPLRIFINPQIIESNAPIEDTDDRLEGCLSVPHIWGNVKRSTELTLAYQDETGEHHTEQFMDFMATIVQHETDHLNGILFTQRVIEQKLKLYHLVKDKDGKNVLEEISLIG